MRRGTTTQLTSRFDDGRGLPERVQAGVGFATMRERAEELGGFPRRPHTRRHEPARRHEDTISIGIT
jgi:hypothetical protein